MQECEKGVREEGERLRVWEREGEREREREWEREKITFSQNLLKLVRIIFPN